MAATIQYNNERQAASVKNAFCNGYIAGATIKKAYGKVTIAASTEANSLAVLADKISPDSIIHTIKITNTAAGSTVLDDNDIVIRKSKDLAKLADTETLLVDGISFAAAAALKEVLGANIATFDRTKTLAEHLELGTDTIEDYVALVLVMNDANSTSAVTLDYEIEYSSPQ